MFGSPAHPTMFHFQILFQELCSSYIDNVDLDFVEKLSIHVVKMIGHRNINLNLDFN